MSEIEKEGLIEELNEAVKVSIKNTIEEAKLFFKHEYEIHGYFRCQLKQNFINNKLLKNKTHLILKECNTRLIYSKKRGIDNGIKFKSGRHIYLKKMGINLKSKKIDFAIWNPHEEFYDEGRILIPKVEICIEIKRQKKDDNKEGFVNEIIKDCKELNDAGNKINYKYLIIIINYPTKFILNIGSDLRDNIGNINIAYCERSNKDKTIIKELYFPDDW